MRTFQWDQLTWFEARDACKSNAIILVPVGSVEQHGPNLPLGTDYLLADLVATNAAKKLNDEGITTYKLPPIAYGMSSMWAAYPGTITLKPETLKLLIKDLIGSLVEKGCKRVVLVNGHAGNSDVLRVACQEAVEELGAGEVASITIWDLCGDLIDELFTTKFFHAGEIETSLAIAAGLRVKEPIQAGREVYRRYTDKWHSLDLTVRPKAYVYRPESRELHGLGSFGRPDLANRDKGEKLLECMISRLAEFIKDLNSGKV